MPGEVRRILCFGDSLTWGWIPVEGGAPSERYAADIRWTGVLADVLGSDHVIIEEGLSGRTVGGDYTDPRLAAADYLPAALATHLPLDLVIMMLGTNDTKAFLHRDPADIGAAMSILVGQVTGSAGGVGTLYPAPKLLLVAPPPITEVIHPWWQLTWAGGREKSRQLAAAYSALADFTGVEFFDAGSLISDLGVDGVHFTEQNNRDLGTALADKVRSILGE
ncbi:hydrolase [Microlunatus elymi]|uniref:Hydrolase n=1 Tax=Microlunatus elymi TaxID=2596828 RepID=A0A516PXU5_9ACTN|nr:SGNH/GDSL hydrolase family protein [Microlunatus elymi]QDP95983.1 hydrolase [Microlunatus elymi]